MRRATAILLALAGVVALLAQASPVGAYVNDRYGVSVDVPADWRADPPPDNDDGRTFHSPDGAATIVVFGNLQIGDSIAGAMDEMAKPRDGERITLLKRGARSLTVSGFAGAQIFYRRSLLTCGGQVWNNVEISYPASQKAAYDKVVAHLAASLRGAGAAGMNCP